MPIPSDYTIEIADVLSAEQLEVINGSLRIYNQTANPELWAKFDNPRHDPKPLQVIVRFEANEIVGGLLATTSMSWLKVDIMSVREGRRRQGIGALMLNAAEAEARLRGCKYAFLDTMDFQAPDFYRACGYVVAGSIADWDSHGHTKFYFTKQLAPQRF